ncbi:MAG: hypothetical protein OEV46_08600 [Betaproteobacteria bacterium]|nr:hypothetical protein [Betaproteobacteria bacterium]MDH5286403.1 hypothetical protein [Betaproteobacteria bacterium]
MINAAGGNGSAVGGGEFNLANGNNSTVGGGSGNNAGGATATVGGGQGNVASAPSSTVGGGANNTAGSERGFVGGGLQNSTLGSQDNAVLGGRFNVASGTASTVAGGEANLASGIASFAAGTQAKTQTSGGTPTPHHGAFVWADNQSFDFNSAAHREFAARATGGVRFVTAIDGAGAPTRTLRFNPNAELEFGGVARQMLNLYGATWAIGVQDSTQYFRTGNHFGWYLNGVHSDSALDPGAGGSMLMTLTNGASTSTVTGTLRAQLVTSTSDRGQKRDFTAVDAQDVLARVVELPIETWAYRNEPGVRHIGPSGQAFQAAFGLGHDDKSIATVDADGVALAAIKGLNEKLEARLADQSREIAELRALIERLTAAR